jgi:translation initiation factor 3 subunit E
LALLLGLVVVGQMYSKKTLLAAKLDLLQPTKMVEYAMDIHRALHESEPPQCACVCVGSPSFVCARGLRACVACSFVSDAAPNGLCAPLRLAAMVEDRDAVYARLEELSKGDALPLITLLKEGEEAEALVSSLVKEGLFTPKHLQEKYDVLPVAITAFYDYAKAMYECGDYYNTSRYLSHYLLLVDPASDEAFSALWGKYAAELLTTNWEGATRSLQRLREAIESRVRPGARRRRRRRRV